MPPRWRGWRPGRRACCTWRRRRPSGEHDPRTRTCCARWRAAGACGASSMPAPAACMATAAVRASTRRARAARPPPARAAASMPRRACAGYGRRAGVRVSRPAHSRHLCVRPRRRRIRASGWRAARRCCAAQDDVLHQPHPRRRPGARLRGRAAARRAAARAARQRRHRAEHGRLLRPRGRPVRAAACAAPQPREAAATAVADAAELHERVAPAGQRPAEARAETDAALPHRGRGLLA